MDKIVQSEKRAGWKELSRLFPAGPEEIEKSRSLFISFEKNGYLLSGVLSPPMCSKAIIIDFFYRLSLIRSVESPIRRKKKATWIHDREFSYFNHRALSLIDEYPLFAQLAELPALRASALILSPFTSNRKNETNTVDSHSVLSGDYCDPDLLDHNISREEQFHLFIEAVHLLGKCIGYSLDYRVDRFAVPVLRRPDLFRWVNVNSTVPYKEMLEEPKQKVIIDKIHKMISVYLQSLTTAPNEDDYNKMRSKLKESGYWTIPSCLENSDQLPFFETNENNPIPHFNGGDNNLTSFKFLNSDKRTIYAPALDYYSSLYIKWRDNFSFDFIKFQGIDYADDEKMRRADSPSLDIIKKVIKKTMGKISHTGIVGALCSNPEDLQIAGFNSVFYKDTSFSVDRSFMERNFNLYTFLKDLNKKKKKQLSIIMHLGHQADTLNRRLFISRFISCSGAFRPKYEIWDQETDSPQYHMVENIYTRYRDIVRKGEIVKHYSDNSVAWWIIRYGSNLLIPLISLDTRDEGKPASVAIDYSDIIHSSRILSVLEYDFTSSGGDLFLCGDDKITCEDLDYQGFRLFSVQ